MQKKSWREISAILGSCCSSLLFGLSYMFTKRIIGTVSTFTLLSWRFTLGALAMTICLLLGIFKVDFRGKPLRWLMLLALFQPVSYFVFETFGVRFVSVSESSTIIACTPIITMAFSYLFLKEPPRRAQILGVLLATAGILTIALVKGMSPTFSLVGYLLLFCAVASNSSYYIVSRKAAPHFSVFERTYAMCLTGAVIFTIGAFIENGINGSIGTYLTMPFVNPDFLLSAAYLGIGCSCTAFFLSNRSISILGSTRTCTFAALTTIISVLSGVFIMRDPFTIVQGIGTVMALTGVYLVNRAPAQPVEPRAESNTAGQQQS
ncbi:MAG: DMT family transporter [Ruminococcaceae bacterium]|jgi:drug/metabolite transporter (DMT)-like permease|nr:DMT family transporter [Oscillospiraceae bacterium]